MPSVSTGQSVRTGPAERLRLVLGGSGTAGCGLQLEGDPQLTLRSQNPTTWVIDASGAGATKLRVVTTVPGQRMSGTLRLSIEAMPVDGTVPPAGSARPKWDVPRVPVEGRLWLEVLAVQRYADKAWELANLLTQADDSRDPLVLAARHVWGDRDRFEHRMLVAVDRSASMSWCYRPGAELDAIYRGVAAVAAAVLRDPVVTWASFGSGADRSDGLQLLEQGATARALRPELFSSGSAPAQALAAAQGQFDHLLLVTDSLVELPEFRPGGPGVGQVTLILVGASDQDDRYLPQEEVDARNAAQQAGVQVLNLPGGLTHADRAAALESSSPALTVSPATAARPGDADAPDTDPEPDEAAKLVCRWLTEQMIRLGRPGRGE